MGQLILLGFFTPESKVNLAPVRSIAIKSCSSDSVDVQASSSISEAIVLVAINTKQSAGRTYGNNVAILIAFMVLALLETLLEKPYKEAVLFPQHPSQEAL